jgi:hypothetical protein
VVVVVVAGVVVTVVVVVIACAGISIRPKAADMGPNADSRTFPINVNERQRKFPFTLYCVTFLVLCAQQPTYLYSFSYII